MGREALSHVLLEHVFQRELQLPWGIRDAGYRSVSRGIDVGIARTRKVGQVGDVERLEAELQIPILPNGRVLDQCGVQILKVGTAHITDRPGNISERKRGRLGKCGGVEPLRDFLVPETPAR